LGALVDFRTDGADEVVGADVFLGALVDFRTDGADEVVGADVFLGALVDFRTDGADEVVGADVFLGDLVALGALEGALVEVLFTTEGLSDGLKLGATDGPALGASDGPALGASDDTKLGASDGPALGASDVSALGASDGPALGVADNSPALGGADGSGDAVSRARPSQPRPQTDGHIIFAGLSLFGPMAVCAHALLNTFGFFFSLILLSQLQFWTLPFPFFAFFRYQNSLLFFSPHWYLNLAASDVSMLEIRISARRIRMEIEDFIVLCYLIRGV